METIQGFPFFPVEFTKDGEVARPEQRKALLAELGNGYTDLFVISHGWNNDMKEARTLYDTFFKHFRAQMGSVPGLDTRKFVIAGVFWPSKKFADKDLIPGSAAPSAGAAASAANTAGRAELKGELEELRRDFFDTADADGQRGFFDAADADERLQKAINLVDRLNDSPAAQREFVELLRGAVRREGDEAPEEQSVEKAFDEDGEKLLTRLGMPAGKRPAGAGGGAAGGVGGAGRPVADAQGGAAGVGSLVRGPIAGARQLLNLITYYQMKERAGRVGSRGLAPVLREIRDGHGDLRLHLVGHSFGGRLLTAAAAGLKDQDPLPIATMTLLQAAFSHFGFAEKFDQKNDGFFRGVLTGKKVQGPVLVTHTHNDKAVTVAYALASRIANQQASFIGDRNDKFGGLGANGALKCAAQEGSLQAPGKAYVFKGGQVYNLKADPFISGHSDIANDATAFAVASAVATT